MSDIYLSITETPSVVTLSAPVVSGVLASTVTVANTVTVALDANSLSALENVTVTVGAAVSVANFPATQQVAGTVTIGNSVTISSLPAISGTVTANVFGKSSSNQDFYPIPVNESGNSDNLLRHIPIGFVNNGDSTIISNNSPLPISGTVTANVFQGQFIIATFAGYFDGTYQLERIGNRSYYCNSNDFGGISLIFDEESGLWNFYFNNEGLQATNESGSFLPPKTGWNISGDISSLSISYESPFTQPISGTVTANVFGFDGANNEFVPITTLQANEGLGSTSYVVGVQVANVNGHITSSNPFNISGTVTVSSLPVSLSTTTIGGTARLNVTLSSATTVGATAPSYANLYGGSDGTNLRAISVDTSGRTVVTGSTSILGTPTVTFGAVTGSVSILGAPSVTMGAISGTVTANNPNGTLTTRFGSVTTANTAQITTAVTNTSRKYLLAQNISTATVTIGIGFSPTTTQGIQLTAGAGLTFDSFVPTGAVYWLGATTGAAYTILEG